jgi:hypothetical protein
MAEWMAKKKIKAVGYDGPNERTQYKEVEYQRNRKGSKGELEN